MGRQKIFYDSIKVKEQQLTEEQLEVIKEIEIKYNVYDVVAKQIAKVCSYDLQEVPGFLNKDSKPMSYKGLKDIDKAVNIINQFKDRSVRIIGDYDVDGVTSLLLLKKVLLAGGFTKLSYYLPNRRVDGYGLNTEMIRKAKEDGVELVITTDNGSSAVEPVRLAKELGMTIVITDHHIISGELPKADAILNPCQADCQYPFKRLAGVGVAYKLAQALMVDWKVKPNKHFADQLYALAALGTICDVVPLVKENRTLAIKGIKALSENAFPQLTAITSYPSVGSIGFQIGPRLNACGRLELADKALEFLETETGYEKLLEKIDKLNNDRKEIQERCFEAAKYQVEQMKPNLPNVLVLIMELGDEGVTGLVANDIMEEYHRPTIIFVKTGEHSYKASGRSVNGYNLYEHVHPLFYTGVTGGGHEGACGLRATSKEEIYNFTKLLLENSKDFIPDEQDVLFVTDVINLEDYDLGQLGKQLSMLTPCGAGNASSTFLIKNVEIELNTRHAREYIITDVALEGYSFTLWGHKEYPEMWRGNADVILYCNNKNIIDIKYISAPFFSESKGKSEIQGWGIKEVKND